MPYKYYKYTCACNSPFCGTSAVICERCGQPGQYAGWRLSIYEAKYARYSRTGLGALSPYQWVFRDAFRTCDECAGCGLPDVNAGEAYRDCPHCEGSGLERLCTAEELRRLRQLASYLVWIDSLICKRPSSRARPLN